METSIPKRKGGHTMFTHEEIQSFNDLELNIYNFIIKNKQKVVYMKIRELAAESHVSTTTILRFCKKLGCDGYSEFKTRFKLYLKQEKEQKPEMDSSILMECFKRLESEEVQKEMNQAVEMLRNADSILFVGIGTSGVLAKYGSRFFSNVGWFSLYIDDPFTPVHQGHEMGTVVVALSESGDTNHALEIAGRLKQRGCQLISITNSKNCTMARMSDCNIAYYMPQIRLENLNNITSQVPVVFVIESLGRKLFNFSADN